MINIYTRFVSIYMLQQLEDPDFFTLEMSQLDKVDLKTIERTGKLLKLQSRQVVQRMISMMRLVCQDTGQISWDDFRHMITTLVPIDLEKQITLFLRAYVPANLKDNEIDSHKFGKEDILRIAKDCLEPLFQVTDDDFFYMLYTNYAKIIHKIVGLEWNQDPAQKEQKMSLRRLKNSICKAEGYEKDMLTLMYGHTGIMELLVDKIHHGEEGGKIQL